MKKILLSAFLLCCFSSFCFADTFVMQDGTKYQGKIVKNTETQTTIVDVKGKTTIINNNAISYRLPEEETDNTKVLYPPATAVKPTKLALISQEINNTEIKMGNGAILGFGAPIAAGFIVMVIPYAFDSGDADSAKAITAINTIVVIAGSIAGAVGLFQYFDGLYTIGHLRAEKYELMLSPFLKNENFVDVGGSTIGLDLKIRI